MCSGDTNENEYPQGGNRRIDETRLCLPHGSLWMEHTWQPILHLGLLARLPECVGPSEQVHERVSHGPERQTSVDVMELKVVHADIGGEFTVGVMARQLLLHKHT